MNELDYICYTSTGHWHFYAYNDVEAARKALYYSWRDGEDFQYIVANDGRIIRLCSIDKKGNIINI